MGKRRVRICGMRIVPFCLCTLASLWLLLWYNFELELPASEPAHPNRLGDVLRRSPARELPASHADSGDDGSESALALKTAVEELTHELESAAQPPVEEDLRDSPGDIVQEQPTQQPLQLLPTVPVTSVPMTRLPHLEEEPHAKVGGGRDHPPMPKRQAWKQPSSPWEHCWVAMSTCALPGGRCSDAESPAACTKLGGTWGAPTVPPRWRRLASKNPCYESLDGGVFCFPFLYSLSPPKSGTTDSYDRLIAHPSILQAEVPNKVKDECLYGDVWWCAKEPMYWPLGARDELPIQDYASLFQPVSRRVVDAVNAGLDRKGFLAPKDETQCAEAGCVDAVALDYSTRNMDINPFWLHAAVPDARFVVILRDPVKRAESEYNYVFWRHLKGCPESPEEVPSQQKLHQNVLWTINMFQACTKSASSLQCWRETHPFRFPHCPKYHSMQTFVLRGLYGVYLNWFRKAFAKDRFFVRRAEDLNFADPNLLDDSRKMLSELYAFAGVEREPPGLDKEATASARAWSSDNFAYKTKYVKLLPKTKDALQKFYEPYVAELQEAFDSPQLKWW